MHEREKTGSGHRIWTAAGVIALLLVWIITSVLTGTRDAQIADRSGDLGQFIHMTEEQEQTQ